MESNVAQLPLSHRIWAWFETNKKPAVLGTTIVVVVGLISWFVSWQRQEKQVAAGNALSDVAARTIGGGANRADAASALLGIASAYPNSSAGARALLLAASSLFTDGKYSEAQAQFEKFTREYRNSPYTGQALIGVAASLDAQNKTDAAIAAYKDLVDHHPNEIVVPEAKFALGRLYAAQDKPELARDMYQDVERALPFTTLGNEAGMRLEELMAKYPKLAPAAPPPAAENIGNTIKEQILNKSQQPTVSPAPATSNQPAQPVKK
jgi:predicted negative regulator of RcsB-dependent stress response